MNVPSDHNHAGDSSANSSSGLGGRDSGSGGGWVSVRQRFDDPLSWSIPLGLPGLRLHALFIIYALVVLLASSSPGKSEITLLDPLLTGTWLTCLLVAALVHEAGRSLSRRGGDDASGEIILWPLGNLAEQDSSPHSSMRAESGGLLANLILCLLCGGILGSITHQWLGPVVPHPLNLGAGMTEGGVVAGSWPLLILYFLNWNSFVILLFNLLPILPLSGGRLLRTALNGEKKALGVGFILAILLGVAGAVMRQWEIIAVAGVGGLTCRFALLRLAYTDQFLGRSVTDEGTAGIEQDQAEAEQVDAILRKISACGLKGLTRRERKFLKKATTREQNP